MKDLQSQIDRREKINVQLTEDMNKAQDKISRLLQNIDELNQGDTDTQMRVRRAERELREEKEKVLRLERELGKIRGSVIGRPPMPAFSDTGSRKGSAAYGSNDALQRKPSNTKGFL